MATIIVKEWDVTGTDPSGSRHLESHASFVSVVASGTSPTGTIDLGSLAITDGNDIGATKCFTVQFSGFADGNETVDSCEFWASGSDLSGTSSKIVYSGTGSWTQSLSLAEDGNEIVPTTSGTASGVLRNDGGLTFFATTDAHTSQYNYIALQASGDMPVGAYGGTTGLDLKFNYSVNTANTNRD